MSRYIVPQEIKSATKVNRFLYLYDFVFIIAYFVIMSVFSRFVHSAMVLPYYLANGIIAFILTRPSKSNPFKRLYQSIYFRIMLKDRTIYQPIFVEKKTMIKYEDYRELQDER